MDYIQRGERENPPPCSPGRIHYVYGVERPKRRYYRTRRNPRSAKQAGDGIQFLVISPGGNIPRYSVFAHLRAEDHSGQTYRVEEQQKARAFDNYGLECYCRITKFQPTEKGGDVGTVHYSIAFKEYRETKVRQVKVEVKTATATVSSNTARTDNTTPPKTYTVKRGDCLWNIAKRFLGSGAKYTQIYNLNRDKIKNPNLIYVGQVLTLP